MKASHTPGPWKITRRLIEGDTGSPFPHIIAEMRKHRLGAADRVPFDNVQAENAKLIVQAPALAAVLIEALQAWEDEFDGNPDMDLDVSGADLVDWFTEWRLKARAALKAAGVEA